MNDILKVLANNLKINEIMLLTILGILLVVLVVLIVVVIVNLIRRKLFFSFLEELLENPEKNHLTSEELLKKTRLFEKFAEKHGHEIIKITGIDDAWIKRLFDKRTTKDMARVMKYAREKGLFTCFAVSLDNERLASLFRQFIGDSQEDRTKGALGKFLPLRELALAGKGESFDGEKALALFKDRLDEIREMTGYPEWQARYFAVKILVHDNSEKSIRAVLDSFEDPYPLVRKTVTMEFGTNGEGLPTNINREDIYKTLYNMVLNDPSPEVRAAAWSRIKRDFRDLYKPDYDGLKEDQLLHALEILDPSSEQDENAALQMLKEKDREVRFYASQFLERSGTLERLLLQAELGDSELLERNYQLLKNAVQTNTISFLSVVKNTNNPASLYIASRILKETGPREIITTLAKRVFSDFTPAGNGITGTDANNEKQNITKASKMILYKSVLETIKARGNDEALKLMRKELENQRNNNNLVKLILSAIPPRADFVFKDYLFTLLTDPEFEDYESLKTAFGVINSDLYIDNLIGIIKAGREKYPHTVRIKALKLLGETSDSECLQFILENIPILPLDEAKEFAVVLSRYDSTSFERKAKKLLQSIDSSIRSSLIAALPATGNKEFLKIIKASVDDSEPSVRIASAWALADFKEYKSLNQTIEMLRDPVQMVREEVARVIGTYGLSDALDTLRAMLQDNNEVRQVKESAIAGLGRSGSLVSIDILLDTAEHDESLKEPVIKSLSTKKNKNELKKLTEHFKDAGPRLKEVITEAFKSMGKSSERGIAELLKEDIPSLKPYIVEILESTGFIEAKIRELKHRDLNVRKEAASLLSLIGSVSAFRGIVLASRDPNHEVRVQVVKALEKLESKEGKKILDELLNDPDKKVRMYTQWAMERLKAKSL